MKVLKIFLLILAVFGIFLFFCFFVGKPQKAEKINWGVDFSQKHAEKLGLDWKIVYLALLDDLKVKRIKIDTYWDLLEPEQENYNFNDLDWQIKEAEKRGVKIILVFGMKTPRWPECHLPVWAKNLNKEKQQESILKLIEKIVLRYRDSDSIYAWQIENEPFFSFGECPWQDKDFLRKEIKLVKSLDFKKRKIVISDTGEWSLWWRAATFGDVVGTTLYRKVWLKELKTYFSSFFPPVFYSRRAWLIKKFFGKEVICIELQAEPWCPNLLYNCSLEEQKKSMSLEQFRKNIEFARKTGIKEFYLWGSEWWYWLRTKHNDPAIWEEAKKLF